MAERLMAHSETTSVRSGDATAFENAMKTYGRNLFRLMQAMTGNRETAEDIVQESFLRLWRNREELDDTYPLYPWLRRVAMNLALNHLGSKEKKNIQLEERMAPVTAPEADPAAEVEAAMAGKELGARMQDALNLLAPERKAILLLRVVNGLTYEQISRELSVPLGTVMSKLHRARLELREVLNRLTSRKEQEIPQPS